MEAFIGEGIIAYFDKFKTDLDCMKYLFEVKNKNIINSVLLKFPVSEIDQILNVQQGSKVETSARIADVPFALLYRFLVEPQMQA